MLNTGNYLIYRNAYFAIGTDKQEVKRLFYSIYKVRHTSKGDIKGDLYLRVSANTSKPGYIISEYRKNGVAKKVKSLKGSLQDLKNYIKSNYNIIFKETLF